MKIVRTPEPGHTGYVGKVHFVDGVAKVDDDAQELTYFRSAGYQVDDEEVAVEAAANEADATELEELDAQSGTSLPDGEQVEYADVDGDGIPDQLPRGNASVETWREFATSHGMDPDEANSKSRDELFAHYKESGQ
jgi:hypothetical protein